MFYGFNPYMNYGYRGGRGRRRGRGIRLGVIIPTGLPFPFVLML